ncbi:CBS domain-containing protein [Caballeronia choica]|jgi:CBS domain-containing protein|uniref:CBS domain-containing protein n=1 Tax=Caballeronia choica TaxID=326476 RepID=A0A158KV81_9BURK|nr:CBS domain-containing protein [Caballeronia choica]SAL84649.1 CBS domain-containing protein [Caballeronia choica]
MNAGKICTLDVIVCGTDASALDAARLMRANHVGDLVVIDKANGNRRPVGMVTDRDIVVSVVAKEVDAAGLLVTDIMSSPAITAFEWEDGWRLLRRMRLHGVRRMPVVDDADALIGIVTLDDLLRFSAEFLSELGHVGGRQRFFEEKARA